MINKEAQEFLENCAPTNISRFFVKAPSIIYWITVTIAILIGFTADLIKNIIFTGYHMICELYTEVVLINTRRANYRILK